MRGKQVGFFNRCFCLIFRTIQLKTTILNWVEISSQFKIIILSWIDNPMQQTQVGISFWIKWSVLRVYELTIIEFWFWFSGFSPISQCPTLHMYRQLRRELLPTRRIMHGDKIHRWENNKNINHNNSIILNSRFFSYFSMPDPTDNCVVNFFPLGESFYACTETKYLRKVDPKTLETLDKVTKTKRVFVLKG